MRAQTTAVRMPTPAPLPVRKANGTSAEIPPLALRPPGRPAKNTPQQESKEEVIEAYLPLVRATAEKIHRRLPPGIDLDSLVHSGIVGLLEALQRYDHSRGVSFQTYARYRIQGEIIEYLRSLDWVSRSVRAWGRKVSAARNRIEGWLGREATPDEMATELDVSLTEYYRVHQKVSEAALLSLEDLATTAEGEWKDGQGLFSDNPFQDPLVTLEKKDLVQKLTTALETLPERERLVLTLYYYEELTLKEIGEIMELSEGRICQIHTQAVTRLRPLLGLRHNGQPVTLPRKGAAAWAYLN